ncbi:MAG: FeoB-associated Cys-rich membrane protein [Erysipelothrix sp.]|nr:FeoB-associated Cys-rich membrane protein [Erysipelothrix sp.]
MGDYIVGGILAMILSVIIYRMIIAKRKGRSITCGSCRYAADCCLKDEKGDNCHSEVSNDRTR